MLRDIEKGLEAGFFRYLTKPIKINEFMNALDDALKFSESVNANEQVKYHDKQTGNSMLRYPYR